MKVALIFQNEGLKPAAEEALQKTAEALLDMSLQAIKMETVEGTTPKEKQATLQNKLTTLGNEAFIQYLSHGVALEPFKDGKISGVSADLDDHQIEVLRGQVKFANTDIYSRELKNPKTFSVVLLPFPVLN